MNAFIDLCQNLVRLPGVSGQEAQVAAYVAELMRRLGFERVEADRCGNISGMRRGALPGPTLLLEAHMDTVAPAPGEQTLPAAGSITAGEIAAGEAGADGIAGRRLWGRGSADTRCALAGMLWAAAQAPVARLAGQVVVAATVCEENMTGAALADVLDRWQPQVFVTGEPTGLHLGVAQKGRATIFLQAHGRSAHTSVPQAGENAVYKMMEAVRRLRQAPQPVDPDLGPALLELTEIISEPYPHGLTVPHGCRARFIARTLPGETRPQLLQRLEAALDGLPGIEIELGTLRQVCYTGYELAQEDFLPGWRNPPGCTWQERLLAALATAGLPAVRYHAPCGTNASAAAARGLPAFIYGPGWLEQAHQADEWVAVDEVEAAERGFDAIIREVLKG